ncbi:juvenile hormone acid O-methyltransferase-like [Pogonomyrmex barbatus]|uniref:Juvenile hormone acid O-methyltransferase-like n=1 Tax=Pogonomyrmex barbatus TaxID=144034 RepID=A0A8N1S4T3_9HYME|nr:juvenile hormone acid O-methyltransferase-like [Pogonomyrmex barbatus]
MEMAEEYAKANVLSRRDGQDIIEEFKIQNKCLDIGSDSGNVTKDFLFPLLPHDVEIIGSDISQSMVNYARKNNSNERLSYIVDIEGKMPNEQIGQYDCVTSFYCLRWTYDLRYF